MKKQKTPKGSITLLMDKPLLDALTRRSLELSLELEKKITRTMIIEKALLKYGIKPKVEKVRASK